MIDGMQTGRVTVHNVLVTGWSRFYRLEFLYATFSRWSRKSSWVNLDALTYAGSLGKPERSARPERYVFEQGDICSRPLVDELMRKYQIDTVVHFAAEIACRSIDPRA